MRECAGIPWAGVSGNVLLCKSYFSSPVSPDAELPEWFEQSTRIASRDLTLQAVGKSGRAVAGLKFASATNPDGGIPSGRSAQEEALCRCSPLSLCLLKDTL
ncbi:hypothetical protein B5G38_11970 [Gemmiger sp. An87]|nr:hypothetical protein B5G38_11970 [Gemmiger sp. An87]